MKNLIMLRLKVKNVSSILFLIFSFQALSQDKVEDATYLFVDNYFSNVSESSVLDKQVLMVDWERFLDSTYLNTNNTGVGSFFVPTTIDISERELCYMKKMADQNSFDTWEKRKINNIEIVKYNNRVRKKVDRAKNSLYRVSIPLFNPDMDYAIIIEEYIGGMENASSFLKIFKLDNSKWKEIAFVQLWIS